MSYFIIKAALSGLIVATVSEVARKAPGLGALIASLPLISVLGMVWLWRDTSDKARLAEHAQATFWYVIPSLPMFLVIPFLLSRGHGFWPALAIGCAVTIALYLVTAWAVGQFGITL